MQAKRLHGFSLTLKHLRVPFLINEPQLGI